MQNINTRPVMLVSNSSWYLCHYRKLLIENLKKENEHILALAPYDSMSRDLSGLLIHIPWRMSRSKNQNLPSFLISFFRMLLIIRAIKPKLIHSHTLQANLITSIVGSFFGINCIFSFAGVGRFAKSKGLSKIFFIIILKVINFFNTFQRESKLLYKFNPKRSIYIFQNQNDIDFINKEVSEIKSSNIKLIHGSGIPNIYISNSNKYKNNSPWLENFKTEKDKISKKITFVYCARLLKNKGILIFIELSKIYPENKFLVFGSTDPSTRDSLTKNDLNFYKKNCINITFMNNIKDPLLSIKNNPSILVVPSFYGEGFPRGVVEANTLSIPVISSKDAAERIPFKNIFYESKSNDIKSYIECINKIIKDYKNNNLSKKLEYARIKAIKNFSEEIIVKKTLKIYKSLNFKKNKSYLLTKDKKKLNNWLSQ